MPAKALSFAVGLFLFSIYLFSFSGKFHVMDELAVFTAGYNLAQTGRADINQLIWTNHWTPNPPGIWGQDGHLYTKKPPGISFLVAPLIGLGRVVPGLNAVHLGLLTNAFITALTAALLLIWLTDLGFTRHTAFLTALAYGLCTIAWVYARMFWESSPLALCFLAAVWAVYRASQPAYRYRRGWWIFLAGVSLALGLTLRFEAALTVVFIGLYLVANRRISESANNGATRTLINEDQGDNPSVIQSQAKAPHSTSNVQRFPLPASRLPFYLAPSLLVGAGLLYFNFIRFGSWGETGYSQEILFREPWVGAFGLLFSPGRGLFIYAPITLLLFGGVRPAWRRLPRLYFWLIAALCLSYWLFYGAWFAWGGAWGWGPRFLLPILPLLMLFVAEAIERVNGEGRIRSERGGEEAMMRSLRFPPHTLRLTLYALLLLSLIVNLLGITVDFNEHFLRLGSNANFVFNWAAFPPLAHWQILREGLVDVIWLRLGSQGLEIAWPVLLPVLLLLILAVINLAIVYKQSMSFRAQRGISPDSKGILHFVQNDIKYVMLITLAALLTFQMMRGTTRVTLADEQAQRDVAVLEKLNTAARPGDALLVPMPPFGDVQEISTRLMAYLRRPLPTYAWIESEPRALQPAERERVWQAAQAGSQRVWLFERWLTQSDPTGPTAVWLNASAFPVEQQWFEQSGKLTLYALAGPSYPTTATGLNIPFQGGLKLVDFAAPAETVAPGEVLKLRLTWQAEATADANQLPIQSLIAFAQLVDRTAGRPAAQSDRLLVDLHNIKQSPLLPGQTVSQGYGLSLPNDLASGEYPLIVGLYQAENGQRLGRADGSPDDFLYLATVKVVGE
ncbi:MAG: glycosyltransferase family 39 protein [Anaerolineae bacterium]